MNKQQILSNHFVLATYRLFKVIYYRLVYDTFIYKLTYSNKSAEVIDPSKKYTLLICHNGGGGTITYLNNKYSNKKDILVLRNTISADKDYLYSLENFETKKRFYFKPNKIKDFFACFKEINILTVESYLSFDKLFDFFKSLNVNITYDLHDFHCIWYEAHLMHNKEPLSYDDIKNSRWKYITRTITYAQWHSIWQNFFPYVSQINAFSNSSNQIFTDFFPDYANNVVVTPHSLEYIKYAPISSIPEKLTIGIFGAINNADKGCYVVKQFLNFIKDKNIEVYINGTLKKECCIYSDNIHYSGPYQVQNLPELIKTQKLSVALFPSVWPETFSYLVSELIAAGLPLSSFNLGAQAEKVSQYEMGYIIYEYSNEAILDSLKKAHQKGVEYYAKKHADS